MTERQAWARVAIYPTSITDVRIDPGVLTRSHPAVELTPEIVALYREAAGEDRALAEMGMTDYHASLVSADETCAQRYFCRMTST